MDISADSRAKSPGAGAVRGYRAGAGLTVALVVWQATMAGQSLSGNMAAVPLHAAGSNALFATALGTAVAALLGWRRGLLAPHLAALSGVVLPLLVALQAWAGYARWLHLHVPLGVVLLGLGVALLLLAPRPAPVTAGRHRR